jgi:EAL domain-containing protein (putative c-di-GMP-specific phosphodiesterase class I)
MYPVAPLAPVLAETTVDGAIVSAAEAAVAPVSITDSSRLGMLRVVASIDNLAEIESAFGPVVARAVRHIVYERARQFSEAQSCIVTMSGEHILFLFNRSASADALDVQDSSCDQSVVEGAIVSLGGAPIRTATDAIIPVVTASIAVSEDAPFDIEGAGSRKNRQGSKGWRACYVADMQAADQLFSALERNELCFRYEKVVDAADPGLISYYEALLCRTSGGVPVSVGSQIPALERLGLVSRLDMWVVTTVIATLRSHKGVCLGCNVSTQSASLDGWWSPIVEALALEPHVAARLVVEITETAPLTDVKRVRDFVMVLQLLGCRVALDDVGAGYSSVRSLTELGMDIVKVDGSYVQNACSNKLASARVRALIDLARECTAHVVLEGIESEEDLQLSRACGAHWVQGYLFEPLFGADLERGEIDLADTT